MRTRSIFRALVAAATVLASLVGVASADAATWQHNGNGTAFTSTTGAIKVAFHPGGGTSAGPSLTCAGTNTATGTLTGNGSAYTGALPGVAVQSLTLAFANCKLAGLAVTVACRTGDRLYGVTWAANGGVAPLWKLSKTSGYVANVSCTLSVAGCAITLSTPTSGSGIPVVYTNPGSTPATTVTSPTGQALSYVASGSGCTSIGIGSSGSAVFGAGVGGSSPPTAATYTVTSPTTLSAQPIIRVV